MDREPTIEEMKEAFAEMWGHYLTYLEEKGVDMPTFWAELATPTDAVDAWVISLAYE